MKKTILLFTAVCAGVLTVKAQGEFVDSYDNIYSKDNQVGIGTISLGSDKLSVNGDVRADGYKLENNMKLGEHSSNNNISYLFYQGNSQTTKHHLRMDNTGYTAINASSGKSIGFTQNGNALMTLKSTGRLGIGTTIPTAQLHVVGDARVQGKLNVSRSIYLDYQDRFGIHYPMYEEASWSRGAIASWVNFNVDTKKWDITGSGSDYQMINFGNNGRMEFYAQKKGLSSYTTEMTMAELQERSLAMVINGEGQVGIGTTSFPTNGNYKLAVDGNIICEELQVEMSEDWGDFVFEEDYKLRSINELKEYVQKEKHLPEVPSANNLEENGMSVAEMLRIQMIKIEELTLYTIEQERKIEELESKLNDK